VLRVPRRAEAIKLSRFIVHLAKLFTRDLLETVFRDFFAMSTPVLTHKDYTVGWVCALSKEQTAATAMLDEIHQDLPKPPNDKNTYTLGCIGKHKIAIASLPEGDIGNNAAAVVATQMASTFPSIKFGVLVGIGGGVPPKVRLGDVVVSTPSNGFSGVVQWDMGKAEQDDTFKRIGALDNPPGVLRSALSKLKTKHELEGTLVPQYLEDLGKKYPRLIPKYTRSKSLKDVLFRADYNHVHHPNRDKPDPAGAGAIMRDYEDYRNDEDDENEFGCAYCDREKIVKRKARDMLVHYGLIASGNRVIKDASFRNKINSRLGGHVLCFETEAAGLMNHFPCIVIRGICDYADSHKNDLWQEHAAAVAAAFTKEFLSMVSVGEVDYLPSIICKQL
jgi:nucleoside phosphorylase